MIAISMSRAYRQQARGPGAHFLDVRHGIYDLVEMDTQLKEIRNLWESRIQSQDADWLNIDLLS